MSLLTGRLPLTPVATRFAFFTADFPSAPWLGHGYTPFVAWKPKLSGPHFAVQSGTILALPSYERETTASFSEVAQCLSLTPETCFSNHHIVVS
jgi:hypothetical protein